MPEFRKLTKAELDERTKRQSRMDLSEYTDYLEEIAPGEGGTVALNEGDTQRLIKGRLTRAARQLNKQIKWRRGEGNELLFEVVSAEKSEPKQARRGKQRPQATADIIPVRHETPAEEMQSSIAQ